MTNETPTLAAASRTTSGKGHARRLRMSGRLPAVVYGRRDDAESLSLDAQELSRLLSRIHAQTTVIDLEVDGKEPRGVLIREIQRHPFRSDILHVDFFEIRSAVMIRVAVPVHTQGSPRGVEMGGLLQQVSYEVEVECLPREIPSAIDVDVTELEIGDAIHVSDLTVASGTIVEDPQLIICGVVPPTTEEEEEEEEGLEEGEIAVEEETT